MYDAPNIPKIKFFSVKLVMKSIIRFLGIFSDFFDFESGSDRTIHRSTDPIQSGLVFGMDDPFCLSEI